MRRTDQQFINEVYKRRREYNKKKKRRNTVLTLLVPVFIFGALLLHAMTPAMSSEKSAEPMLTYQPTATSAPDSTSVTYPPGTVTVEILLSDDDSSSFVIEGSETVDFIEQYIWNGYQNSSLSSSGLADNYSDKKTTLSGEIICRFSFSISNNGTQNYSYILFKNGLYDELNGTWYNLESERVAELESILLA